MIDNNFIKELKKINPFIDTLEESNYGTITEYISTGSLVLNGLVSGDFNKGIPAGRITILSGKSGVGKSFIAANICRDAIHKGYTIIWFDSEHATDKEFAIRLGMSPENIIYIPSVAIPDLEAFRNTTTKILEIYAKKYPDKKLLMVLDSLGNLGSSKEHNDAAADKKASDMGQRGKVIRSIFRVLTPSLVANAVTFLAINHTYGDPVNPYGGEKESGGEGAIYNPTVSIRFSKAKVTDTDKKVTGTLLKPLITKNRIAPPLGRGEILLDFSTGVDKYYGLLPIALSCGLIWKEGKKYCVENIFTGKKGEEKPKTFWEKSLYTEEVFEPLLERMNAWLSKNNTYSVIEEEHKELLTEAQEVE